MACTLFGTFRRMFIALAQNIARLRLESRRIFLACVDIVVAHCLFNNLIIQFVETFHLFKCRLTGPMLKQFCHAIHVCLAQHIVNISSMLPEMIDFFQNTLAPRGREKAVEYIHFFLCKYFLYGMLFFIQPLFFSTQGSSNRLAYFSYNG